MSQCEAAVPANAPVMIAWEAYKLTEEYANAKRWAVQPEHTEGSLWRLFYEGYYAGAVKGVETALQPNTTKPAMEDAEVTQLLTLPELERLLEKAMPGTWFYLRAQPNTGAPS